MSRMRQEKENSQEFTQPIRLVDDIRRLRKQSLGPARFTLAQSYQATKNTSQLDGECPESVKPTKLVHRLQTLHPRYKRALLTSAASLASRMPAVVNVLVVIPLSLRFLGADQYGLWVTITSLTSVLTSLDFGIGNGLTNAISRAYANEDRKAARMAVSTSFFLLLGLAGVLILLACCTVPFVPWSVILKYRSNPGELSEAILAFAICVAVSLPISVVQRIQIGFQEGYLYQAWLCAASTASTAAIIVALYCHPSLPTMILTSTGIPAFVVGINSWRQFTAARPWLKPQWRSFDFRECKTQARTGLSFFAAQIGTVAVQSMPYPVITSTLGPGKTAIFTLAFKSFSILTVAVSALLSPLWPAYGEAAEKNDWKWVRAAFHRSLALSLGGAIAFAAMLLGTYRYIFPLWVGRQALPSLAVMLCLGLFQIANAIRWVTCMFLNGCERLKGQVYSQIPAGVASLAIALWACPRFGLIGAAAGLTAGEFLVATTLLLESLAVLRSNTAHT